MKASRHRSSCNLCSVDRKNHAVPTHVDAQGKRAFSLVELSIVLVILGLLVGGVLAGQSLIRAAELRAVTSEYARYTAAIMSFRDKYFALPGDMPNATQFWGPNRDTGAGCPSPITPDTGTCNGDGAGFIGPNTGQTTTVTDTSFENEGIRAWYHLAKAGLIEGSYNQQVDMTGVQYNVYPGINVPRGKISNSYWILDTRLLGTFSDSKYNLNPDSSWHNSLVFRSDTPIASGNNYPLTPAEAWNIDKKMDDGLPSQGKLIGFPRSAVTSTSGCGFGFNYPSPNYNLDIDNKQCALQFLYLE
jgi:prepilin-type N-terminal cleavage/methylation domain-containing protein